jgi:hypothetical protein
MLRLQLRLRTTMIAIALIALGAVVVLEERRLAALRAEMQAAEQQLEMEHRATLLQKRERKLYEKLRSPVGRVLENLERLSQAERTRIAKGGKAERAERTRIARPTVLRVTERKTRPAKPFRR